MSANRGRVVVLYVRILEARDYIASLFAPLRTLLYVSASFDDKALMG